MRSLELRVPPPVVAGVAAGLMWLIASAFPALAVGTPGRVPLALVLLALGILTTLSGVLAFRKAQTTINPMTPEASSTVVSTGIYRFTHNPMYLGMLLVLLAWAAALGNVLALLGPVAFVLYMNRFQIAPEERALQQKFGPAYSAYLEQVRRWL